MNVSTACQILHKDLQARQMCSILHHWYESQSKKWLELGLEQNRQDLMSRVLHRVPNIFHQDRAPTHICTGWKFRLRFRASRIKSNWASISRHSIKSLPPYISLKDTAESLVGMEKKIVVKVFSFRLRARLGGDSKKARATTNHELKGMKLHRLSKRDDEPRRATNQMENESECSTDVAPAPLARGTPWFGLAVSQHSRKSEVACTTDVYFSISNCRAISNRQIILL